MTAARGDDLKSEIPERLNDVPAAERPKPWRHSGPSRT